MLDNSHIYKYNNNAQTLLILIINSSLQMRKKLRSRLYNSVFAIGAIKVASQ